jgi:hypothetical protein
MYVIASLTLLALLPAVNRGNLMSVAPTISPPSLEGVGGGWLCALPVVVSLPPSLCVSQ